MKSSPADKIARIIHNQEMAHDLVDSIMMLTGSSNRSSRIEPWPVFKNSMDEAIRDIWNDKRGPLFKRLLEFGPQNPGVPKTLKSDKTTTLSDPECGECVEFIFSHLVNRFKGELAELLAIKPLIKLVKHLESTCRVSEGIRLHRGDEIKEKRRYSKGTSGIGGVWGNFVKGADGILVNEIPCSAARPGPCIFIAGIIEIKSMAISKNKIKKQIKHHFDRLQGGLQLCGKIWPPENIIFKNSSVSFSSGSDLFQITVNPSKWKLNSEWQRTDTKNGWEMEMPEQIPPTREDDTREIEPGLFRITLSWSQEALHEAAYEMTFWCMSEVWQDIYKDKPWPKEFAGMTPEEAGYNAIKMMLYYIPLRYISKRHFDLAVKLYNIYGFGYPVGSSSKEMLWI